MNIGLLFPHQLFEKNPLLSDCDTIYMVEEFLFFNQYNFHKQKLVFHRASMKNYERFLLSKNIKVVYIEANQAISDIRTLIPYLKSIGISSIQYIDTTDNWLEHRITSSCISQEIKFTKIQSSLFINTSEVNSSYFSGKKKFFQTDFYKHQRIKWNLLLEASQQPKGGKWSFDDENRLKYPKNKIPPKVEFIQADEIFKEAEAYVLMYYPNNYGEINQHIIYPFTFHDSKKWLQTFLEQRFSEFGAYEDAIVAKENFLHHSVLTPMLNVGLLTPEYIIDEAVSYAEKYNIPINSLEGFVRQIIGWREFIRAVYEIKGSEERSKNYWGFTRKIPASFWNGTTGIEPIDITIKKILKTGYCHHIERLMVLGNFMLLCEFDPDEVYRWFMELFIDAYDWVMVPNVYGMSQFADGGLMSTKPYISGSNYLMKMSDYPKGDWQPIWDGLFWRFMHVHRDFFLQNPRLAMLVNSFDKMSIEKQALLLKNADAFLRDLDY
jgi:deoxyribodipyrimidine photolyase-related protein